MEKILPLFRVVFKRRSWDRACMNRFACDKSHGEFSLMLHFLKSLHFILLLSQKYKHTQTATIL